MYRSSPRGRAFGWSRCGRDHRLPNRPNDRLSSAGGHPATPSPARTVTAKERVASEPDCWSIKHPFGGRSPFLQVTVVGPPAGAGSLRDLHPTVRRSILLTQT